MMSQPESGLGSLNHTFFLKVLYFISSSTATFSSWKKSSWDVWFKAQCSSFTAVHSSFPSDPMVVHWKSCRWFKWCAGGTTRSCSRQKKVTNLWNISCQFKVSSSDCTENTIWSSNSSFSQSVILSWTLPETCVIAMFSSALHLVQQSWCVWDLNSYSENQHPRRTL